MQINIEIAISNQITSIMPDSWKNIKAINKLVSQYTS